MVNHLLLLSVLSLDTMFRGGPAHTGVSAAAKAPGLSSVKWKFKTRSKVISTPLVHDGRVYFGSGDHKLYAVNEADGALVWSFQTGMRVDSSPAWSGGLIYFLSGDGNFYALEAATGKVRWKFATEGERRFTAPGIHGAQPRKEMMPDPFDVFLSSPTIADGNVYFGSGDGHVYALEATGGALRWKFKTGDVVHATPAIDGGVVYIGSWDRNLYALDAKTGGLQWKFQTGEDTKIYNQVGIASSAAVVDGIVYFGCRDGHFYAVNATDGSERWKVDNHSGWVIASPTVSGGLVYFPTSDGRRFKAVDAASGKPVWDVAIPAISFSSPMLAAGRIYFGTSHGWLRALDQKTGKLAAEFQTEGSKENSAKYITQSGLINEAALYPDFSLDGIIIGRERMFSLGSVLSSPVISGGVVFFGSTDGHLYAVQ